MNAIEINSESLSYIIDCQYMISIVTSIPSQYYFSAVPLRKVIPSIILSLVFWENDTKIEIQRASCHLGAFTTAATNETHNRIRSFTELLARHLVSPIAGRRMPIKNSPLRTEQHSRLHDAKFLANLFDSPMAATFSTKRSSHTAHFMNN